MPADAVRGLARDLAAAPSAAVHGRMGVSTQAHGVVCQWAVQTINMLTGNLDRPGGTMLTTPAVDLIGRGVLGPGGFGTRRSRVRGLPSFGGELPVSVLEEEITTPGEGQVRALLTIAGNPVSSTPSGHRLDEALAGPRRDGVDRLLRQRDHPARRRHPAADRAARARPLRHRLPPPRRARHRPVVAGASSSRSRARGRLGDRPRPRRRPAARAVERAARPVVAGHAADRGPAAAQPAPAARRAAALVRGAAVGGQARGDDGRCRPRRRSSPGCPSGWRPPTSGSTSRPRWCSSRCPGCSPSCRRPRGSATASCCSSAGATSATTTPGCTTRPRLTRGRPRHALLAHPDDLAARGIRDGDTVVVRSAVGGGARRGGGDRRRHARRGVAAARLRPPAPGGAAAARRRRCPASTMNDLTDASVVEGLSGNAVLNGVPVTARQPCPRRTAGSVMTPDDVRRLALDLPDVVERRPPRVPVVPRRGAREDLRHPADRRRSCG